ncbi:hypothetical protein ABZ626_30690 [Streptomyces longispororuber]
MAIDPEGHVDVPVPQPLCYIRDGYTHGQAIEDEVIDDRCRERVDPA